MLMTACSFAAGYYVHSQLPEGASATAERTPAVQEVRQESSPVAPPTVEQGSAVTGASATAPDRTATSTEAVPQQETRPQQAEQPASRPARQTASSASLVAPRSTPRVVNASHGMSVTGSHQAQPVDDVKPDGATLPVGTASKPVSAPQQTDPLNPPTNAKPTVTSGAQSSPEMKPTVSEEGTIRDSHGNPQRVLPPQEGPK